MQSLLKEDGRLAGLLFDKEFEKGPPFGGSKNEYLDLFSTEFEILKMEACLTSAKPRLGTELFFEATNKTL